MFIYYFMMLFYHIRWRYIIGDVVYQCHFSLNNVTLVTISNWHKINISWHYFITLGDDNYVSKKVTISLSSLICWTSFHYWWRFLVSMTHSYIFLWRNQMSQNIDYKVTLLVIVTYCRLIRDDIIISSLFAFSDGSNVTKVVTSIFSSQNSNGDVNLTFSDIILNATNT